MKIINNKIIIARGETPTYSASAIDKETGAPFIITKGMLANRGYIAESDVSFVIEFVVKTSIYASKKDVVLKYNLVLGKDMPYHIFDDEKIASFNTLGTPEWDSENNTYKWNELGVTPLSGNANRLHCFIDDSTDEKFYVYYSEGAWKDYEFVFNVTFQYEHTSKLEAKTYLYEVVLYSGLLKTSEEIFTEEYENNFAYPVTVIKPFDKKPLAGPYEFKVEGSISE